MPETKGPLDVLLIDLEGATFIKIMEQFSKKSPHRLYFDVARSISEAVEKIKMNHYHLVLADNGSHDHEGFQEVIAEMNRRHVKSPLILLIEPNSKTNVHKSIKLGATDYLVKTDEELHQLPERLWSILKNYELTQGNQGLGEQIQTDNGNLIQINEKLSQLSLRDELTGLFNHRYFQERLFEEFARSIRYGHPISCLLFDLDNFRKINDALGHSVGDEILKESAEILLEGSRVSDLVSRFGGEEFAILLPHTEYQGAFELAERLQKRFAVHTFLSDSHQISVTVSIGIASFPDDPIRHRSDLLNYADQALFQAKAGGRNRITLYRDLLPTIGEMLPHLKISEEKILEFQKKLSQVADQARRVYLESSKALIKALESKDSFTVGHSERVAKFSLHVAEAMGFALDEAETVEHAGLLHDIGKICIADEILLKPDRLTLAEYETMKQHPYFGYRILKPIKFLQKEATLVLHHHEWYNGQGYPSGLAESEIPIGARIISVIDSYDTMRMAGGRYKKILSVVEAVDELIACTGTQFDPGVIRAFVQVLLMRKELSANDYNKERLQQALESDPRSK